MLAESLALTAALFIIGVMGVLIHRNAIIISIFRHRQTVDLKNINLLKG